MEKPWVSVGEWSPSGKSRGHNPRGLRHHGFWPWDFPRDSIHHFTPWAFPNNVSVASDKCPKKISLLGNERNFVLAQMSTQRQKAFSALMLPASLLPFGKKCFVSLHLSHPLLRYLNSFKAITKYSLLPSNDLSQKIFSLGTIIQTYRQYIGNKILRIF